MAPAAFYDISQGFTSPWSNGHGEEETEGGEWIESRLTEREANKTAEIIHEPAEREKKKSESEEQGREA